MRDLTKADMLAALDAEHQAQLEELERLDAEARERERTVELELERELFETDDDVDW